MEGHGGGAEGGHLCPWSGSTILGEMRKFEANGGMEKSELEKKNLAGKRCEKVNFSAIFQDSNSYDVEII